MAEPLGDLREHTPAAPSAPKTSARTSSLLGWVHRIRDLGGVTFIDIRDRAGVSQVVVRENDALMADREAAAIGVRRRRAGRRRSGDRPTR